MKAWELIRLLTKGDPDADVGVEVSDINEIGNVVVEVVRVTVVSRDEVRLATDPRVRRDTYPRA